MSVIDEINKHVTQCKIAGCQSYTISMVDWDSIAAEIEALRKERDELLKRDINAIANRICGEIPDGFYIELILENGCGVVSLMHKDEQVDIDMADWNIAEQFDVAMQCVDELAKEQGDAKNAD